jgi:riboflavin kinase / FMN adenylyltransferase
MHVIHGMEEIPADLKEVFVTIGNFDGIHLGHRYIFARMIEEARQAGRKTVVISFDPHPKMVLHPDKRPFYLISSSEEKIRLLGEIGIDAYIILPFSLEYAQTTAEEFVRGVLWEKLRVKKVIIGHDYTFGRGKKGNEAFIAEEGRRLGFAVEAMNAFRIGDEIVSSTKIREAILRGDVHFAAMLLGRPYNISGRVVPGDRRGLELGFPTANVEANKELLPLRGVYAVCCLLRRQTLDGVLNIGFNPTFAGGRLSIEVHIFDFHENIYGEALDVLFIERIRDEVRFAGPEELIVQIGKDVSRARELLSSRD